MRKCTRKFNDILWRILIVLYFLTDSMNRHVLLEKKEKISDNAVSWNFYLQFVTNEQEKSDSLVNIDCALGNVELPACTLANWKQTKRGFFFLFMVIKGNGEDRRKRTVGPTSASNQPFSAIFSGESYDRNKFSPRPLSGSRAPVETGTNRQMRAQQYYPFVNLKVAGNFCFISSCVNGQKRLDDLIRFLGTWTIVQNWIESEPDEQLEPWKKIKKECAYRHCRIVSFSKYMMQCWAALCLIL